MYKVFIAFMRCVNQFLPDRKIILVMDVHDSFSMLISFYPTEIKIKGWWAVKFTKIMIMKYL